MVQEGVYKRFSLTIFLVISLFICLMLSKPVVLVAQEIGNFLDAKVIGQRLNDNFVVQQKINNNGELLIRGQPANSGGSTMDASFIIMFFAVAVMIAGFALKKSWLLWLAIPLFFILFLYWAYLETWFPTNAQHSLIFLSLGTTLGLAFSAIRMQAKPANEHQTDDNLDDTDASDRYYQAERKKYKRK